MTPRLSRKDTLQIHRGLRQASRAIVSDRLKQPHLQLLLHGDGRLRRNTLYRPSACPLWPVAQRLPPEQVVQASTPPLASCPHVLRHRHPPRMRESSPRPWGRPCSAVVCSVLPAPRQVIHWLTRGPRCRACAAAVVPRAGGHEQLDRPLQDDSTRHLRCDPHRAPDLDQPRGTPCHLPHLQLSLFAMPHDRD